jgi:hypothetical protein
VVQVAHWVRITKGACKCGGVGSVRDELHRALKNTRHSGPCGRLRNTKLYKSGHWGQECVHQVRFTKAACKCSKAGNTREELLGALRDLKHEGRSYWISLLR